MQKSGQVWEELTPWIIGIIVLVLVVIFYGILSGKLSGMGDFVRNLFRFG